MIEFENVTKSFADGTKVLDGLNLHIPAGKITVLVGTSGCGKTTTLRMINRMVEPTSGRVLLDGKDVRDANRRPLRRSIGYVIQHAGLFPHRTIVDNIATVPRLLGWDRRRRPGTGRGSCSSGSGWTPRWPGATPTSSPAASSSASGWPARSPPTRRCC